MQFITCSPVSVGGHGERQHKFKMNYKQKTKTKNANRTLSKYRNIYLGILTIFTLALIVPFVAGSGEGLPLMNLWDLFVENIFGSFWIAVLFIAMVYFILLMLAGISMYTILLFFYYYFVAMAIGYGEALIWMPLAFFGMASPLFQLIKWGENR